jgi:hypothetical protein
MCQALGTIAGVVVSLIGFIFVSVQLRQNRSTIEGQIHALVYQLGNGIYIMFIEHPELRPYFYDNKPLPQDETEREKVFAAAEMLCDFFEYVVHGRTTMAKQLRQGWLTYMRAMYSDSTCLQHYLENYKINYTSEFIKIISSLDYSSTEPVLQGSDSIVVVV